MKRVALFAVIGALGGTAIGTGSAVMFSKPAEAATEHATDSAAVVPEKPFQEPKIVVADTAQPIALDTAVTPPPTDSVAATASVLDSVAQPSMVRATLGAATVDSAGLRIGRLAKLFTAMAARDAAKVLVQLDDADVQQIISRVTDKQAAAILSNFPADRAAAVTRLTLHKQVP